MSNLRKYLTSCPSTNDEAAYLLKNSLQKEGLMLWTCQQTAGRGQKGSVWHTEKGKSLATTTVFYPSFIAVENQFDLSIAVALATQRLIQYYLPEKEVLIKWPNDIFVDGFKIAGILIETSISEKKLSHAICGIGLNVNQNEFIPPRGASLAYFLGTQLDIAGLVVDLHESILKEYEILKNGFIAAQKRRYLSHLYNYQEPSTYYFPNGNSFKGIIQGLKRNGELVIEVAKTLHSFKHKEVSFFPID